MAVNTVLLDFSVDPIQVKSDNQMSVLSTQVEDVLRNFLSNFKVQNTTNLHGSVIKVYTSDRDTITNLRIYNHGLITINIEYFRAENQEPVISFERCGLIEASLLEHIEHIKKVQRYAPVKRGNFMSYYSTSDERLLEYDIDSVVYEERSAFQNIQIVHSKSLGNMLVLDGLQNISEADLIYTETLMQRGIQNYKGKDIVILGGGDGALLYELLKESPNNVIMLEIDEKVIEACNKHMKSICGDVLEKRSGPNYQIIIGDCMKSLNMFVSEGRKFDYIFGDLTDIPISGAAVGEMWEFIIKALQMTFKLLKPDGKYMTHGNGLNCPESLKLYESQIKKLDPSVIINKTQAFIPSFLEDWVFYQLTFENKP